MSQNEILSDDSGIVSHVIVFEWLEMFPFFTGFQKNLEESTLDSSSWVIQLGYVLHFFYSLCLEYTYGGVWQHLRQNYRWRWWWCLCVEFASLYIFFFYSLCLKYTYGGVWQHLRQNCRWRWWWCLCVEFASLPDEEFTLLQISSTWDSCDFSTASSTASVVALSVESLQITISIAVKLSSYQ